MDRLRALELLNEIVTDYLAWHQDSELVEPTNMEVKEVENYIVDNLK